jgi:hypothetical protein
MSAWLVGKETLASIASGLCNLNHYNQFAKALPEDEVRKLVLSWNAANIEALKQRYGDENKPVKLPKTLPAAPSAVQLVKSLQCLSYQCSEGNVGEGCFVEEIKALRGTIMELCEMIVQNLPEYNTAVWG